MTFEERKEKIENFKKLTYERFSIHSYIDLTTNCDEIINYLLESLEKFPNSPLPSRISDYWFRELSLIFSKSTAHWNSFDLRLLNILSSSGYWKDLTNARTDNYGNKAFFDDYLKTCLSTYPNENHIVNIKRHFSILNISEDELLDGIINYLSEWNLINYQTNNVTNVGEYIIEKTNFDFGNVYSKFNQDKRYLFLQLLLCKNQELDSNVISKFIYLNEQYKDLDLKSFEVIVKFSFNRNKSFLINILDEIDSSEKYHLALKILEKYYPEEFSNSLDLAIKYFQKVESQIIKNSFYYYNDYKNSIWNNSLKRYVSFFELELDILERDELEKHKNLFFNIFKFSKGAEVKMLLFQKLYPIFKEDFVNLVTSLDSFLNLNSVKAYDYYKTILSYIPVENFEQFIPQFFSFCTHSDKKVREYAAIIISKFNEKAIPQATELLQNKKADVRQTGALILSLIKTDKALEILNNALETEKNDDARDLMLEGLKGVLTLEPSQEKIKAKVAKAKERGKIEKSIEIWLNEAQMPALFWKDGTKLDLETTRFLLYRMSRAKDIRIDIEAKSILDLLDKTQSQAFANALLKAYFSMGGADAKQKYCLTLGSILGDDDEIDLLKRKVNEWVENSRGKMAEYAVKAIALNGSTKALRAVEFFSRKYKNKNKNIGAAANESFTLVAEELGVSPYDLADAIIPDFGFDGLFKEFEVNGETYRAFIGNDFKLAFLNEDNKFFKSVPKGTAKETQEEFKEIGKEIRDIVKSQSSRLEQYLVIQRKWNAEKWQAFFMTNPVMFVYAIRLIWGVFDEKQQLLFTFSVQEDQTLVNEEGDEMELEEGVFIGMVHPISLEEAQKSTWNERLADADLEPIFPQLTRPVISFREKDKGIKMSKEFQGIEFGGYAFVAKLEKTGWFRGSVVDGGGISSYYKDFSELGITAILMQEGCIGVGYLDDNAVLGELMFVSNKSVQFGSYMYDEPSKVDDPRLIPFENVPAIIYSEVIADMQFFKDNDAKKKDENNR